MLQHPAAGVRGLQAGALQGVPAKQEHHLTKHSQAYCPKLGKETQLRDLRVTSRTNNPGACASHLSLRDTREGSLAMECPTMPGYCCFSGAQAKWVVLGGPRANSKILLANSHF